MESQLDGITRREQRKLLFTLVGIAAVCGVLGGFLLRGAAATGQTFQLGDLSDAQMVEVRDTSGRTVLSGEFRARTAPSGKIEKDAALTDRSGSKVIGEVEIEIPPPDAPGRPQELEIDIITLAPRMTYTVVVDDRPITTFTTDDRGSIDVEIESGAGLSP